MILSKARVAPGGDAGAGARAKAAGAKLPDLGELIARRDYQGAITMLEFRRASAAGKKDVEVLSWLAYCYVHYGEHGKALELYQQMLGSADPDPTLHTYAAVCLFYMGRYAEAEEEALQGPASRLQTRLLFHLAHKAGDEARLMQQHAKLTDSLEDQLSLASVHYLRGHYQEATEVYKRLLLENREFLALNVFVALCYSKLDYYDVSLEILGVYLQQHPDSAVALNLRACNHFKLHNGHAAEGELKSATEEARQHDLIRHNMVVFRGGEGAPAHLPRVVDVLPEARLNLVIYHLRNGEPDQAFELMKDVEPTTPNEYILRAVVHIVIGQRDDSQEHLKTAQQYLQLVGASESEKDTIPGRQCMASCFFLLRQFDDVMIYLESIKQYFANDDDFLWNYGIAKAATGGFEEAADALMSVQSEKYRSEYTYVSWLARCHVMNGSPRHAWELYLRMETSDESFSLLQLVASDCYRMGHFFYSAKAFDVLERLDPSPEYFEGKRGACVGVLQAIIAGKEPVESLRDVVSMLRNTSNPSIEYILRVVRKWGAQNGIET